MHTSCLFHGLALAITAVTAQYYDAQSLPFHLIIVSHNKTLNGLGLTSCHEGAAIEGLCHSDINPNVSFFGPPATFFFNTSSSYPTANGVLVWNLEVTGEGDVLTNFSQPMQLTYNPSSNVAQPIFSDPDEQTPVTFTNDSFLAIVEGQDDTKPLPNYSDTLLRRWYICETYYQYLYPALTWVVGKNRPQNPTCQKVEIKRVFI